MNPEVIREQSNYYLLLFSGLQMLCVLYYDYSLPYGNGGWVSDDLFSTFKYGAYSLFLTGLIYHCISQPLCKGTSGIPLNYICVLLNINQICAIVCFFYPLMKFNPKNGYTIFQLIIYIPTAISGILLNIYGWTKKNIPPITVTGSWVLSRRRDWGIVGVFLAAAQLVLLFNTLIGCFANNTRIKTNFGNNFNTYVASLFLLIIGALGYHVLALKVSKGKCPCHDTLKYITFSFVVIELLGMIIYCYTCTKAKQTKIFYYHCLLFGVGMIVSGIGNTYLGWKKFDEDVSFFDSLYSQV